MRNDENEYGKMSLNGSWKLRWADGQRGGLDHHASTFMDETKWLNASVPGEVHLDLMNAGLIEDPCIGLNFLSARWVEECMWSYRRTFEVPETALKEKAWLFFEGLDYHAKIFLNGIEVGSHANYFLPCRIPVTGKLKEGQNTLVVQLDSGLFETGNKSVEGHFFTHPDTNLSKRIWLRKPQCSFGWDWSTRLLNVGIHKPVWLEWAKQARVNQTVVLSDLSEDMKKGTVKARVFVEGLEEQPVTGELTIKISETNLITAKQVTIQPGTSVVEIDCEVEYPRLWWPVGHGKQELYTVHVQLSISGDKIGETSKNIGFRKVRINQDPHPEGGQFFVIEVNDRPIFAKGANFVPADMIFARIDRERYEGLINRALEANFNMLRVWGGGLYESDDFYELCDQKGILVWQEFIFACGSYPANDREFLENVKLEASFQVRRLASHPSLVVWCGNNEIEWLTWNVQDPFTPDSKLPNGPIYPDYGLYHNVLPRIIQNEDPGRYYQPSSPISPNNAFPNADDVGDQHPWSIGFGNVNFHEYRNMTCRFPNEGGILGPTSLPSIQASLPEGQKYIASFAWEHHDNGVEQWFEKSAPDRVVSEWIDRDPREMSLEEFTFYGGLVQGEGLKEYIDNFRRRMFSSSSAIFWMYNDCWPATRSWTIVDYYLNRTPAFYPVKRAFAPISVVVTHENHEVRIYGINENQETFVGELRYGLFDLTGNYPIDRIQAVEIPENSSICLASFDADHWNQNGINDCLAFAMLTSNDTVVARNRLFLPRFHEMNWVPASIEVCRDGEEAVFLSKNFAWGVCLDLDGVSPLPDNFFDVWPGIPHKLSWPSDKPLPSVVRVGNLI